MLWAKVLQSGQCRCHLGQRSCRQGCGSLMLSQNKDSVPLRRRILHLQPNPLSCGRKPPTGQLSQISFHLRLQGSLLRRLRSGRQTQQQSGRREQPNPARNQPPTGPAPQMSFVPWRQRCGATVLCSTMGCRRHSTFHGKHPLNIPATEGASARQFPATLFHRLYIDGAGGRLPIKTSVCNKQRLSTIGAKEMAALNGLRFRPTHRAAIRRDPAARPPAKGQEHQYRQGQQKQQQSHQSGDQPPQPDTGQQSCQRQGSQPEPPATQRNGIGFGLLKPHFRFPSPITTLANAVRMPRAFS